MKRTKTLSSTFAALLTSTVLTVAGSAMAAEVTPERLLNPDKEPQNWLMNHRTYDGQRFSPLAGVNKDNVKGLKLAYAVPLGGSSGNEYNEATAPAYPLLSAAGYDDRTLAHQFWRLHHHNNHHHLANR